MIDSYKTRNTIKLTFTYLFIGIMILIALFPALWIFSGSLNPGHSLFSTKFIPENATFIHYKELFQETDFGIWYINTLKVGAGTAILGVFLASLTAYAFSRLKFAGRKVGMMVMLIIQVFPGVMSMVALYVLLNLVELLDTHIGLIIIYAAGTVPYHSWLMKGYLDTIPKSLEEAAIIDGASHWKIFWTIILPLAIPMLSVLALFYFVAPFGDFLFARLVITSPDKWTLALGLYEFVVDQYGKNFTIFAAGSLLAAIPILILHLSMQSMLVSGLTRGANKG